MSGGRGRTGFLVRNMVVGQWYEPKDIEEIFRTVRNPYGEVTREQSKALVTSILRRQCYDTERTNNPRLIRLTKPFLDKEVKLALDQKRALTANALISQRWRANAL